MWVALFFYFLVDPYMQNIIFGLFEVDFLKIEIDGSPGFSVLGAIWLTCIIVFEEFTDYNSRIAALYSSPTVRKKKDFFFSFAI